MRAIRQLLVSLALLAAWTSSYAITHGELFTWAAATYPALFAGTPVADQYLQYDYRHYPSGNFLAVGEDDGVYLLGPVSDNQIIQVGSLADFAAAVIAWEGTQPVSAYRGKVLIRAWNPDGSAASIQDFVNFTHYVLNRWSQYANFGIFQMGKPPAAAQIGSQISPANVDGINYIAMDVPRNERFYFTALWKASVIGTVFMRADAEGSGYVISGDQPLKLELPYDFALSEYQQARRLPAAASPSASTQQLLSQASAAIDAARNAPEGSARALASYAALSSVMPLKEQLVLDASAAWLAANGPRPDFDLNYEGFGSWTDDRFVYVAGYNAAKEAGFASVYTVVPWAATSPRPGVYDFSALDYQVDRAQARGFKIALNINGNKGSLPAWAQDLGFEALKSLYYENARAVVAHYGSRISLYYPTSELELDTRGITIEQAAELARQALNGARAAAPNTPFGYYGSAAAYVSYQMNLVENPNYLSGMDLIAYMARNNIHHDFIGLEMQYGTTFAPIDLQRFQEVLQDTYKIAQVPIYLGETGYSSMAEDYGIAGGFYWHDGLTRQSQYEWADGTVRTLYAMPFVKGYYWVHLDADNDDRGSDYLSGLVGTGFVSATGAVKKVQSAFKDFTMQLSGMAASRPAGQ